MSDHDPIDRAYTQAEAMLDDEAARAARRARVLGAVTGDAGAAPVAPPKRRVFPAAGWLAAASVAGVSALVAFQLARPPVMQRPLPPAERPVAAAPAPAVATATAPAVEAAPPASTAAPARVTPPADVADVAPSPFPAPPSPVVAPPAAKSATPPAAPPVAESGVEALIVTGQRREESLRPLPRSAPFDAATAQAPSAAAPALPADRTGRLHAAAAAGRVDELTALLAQGTPVDAPDSDGETALMKSIEANHPAAAALLRRYGANLDRTNRAGVSAREMAASIDDSDLNQALGLEP